MIWIKRINEKEFHLKGIKKITKYFLLFFICSTMGWIFEGIQYLILEGKFINRGFLYGPYLPVYGFGAVFITLLLKEFKKKALLIFILSMILNGILEYCVAFVLDNVWDKKLWDYSGKFLNLNGYICFTSIFSFGFAGILIIYIIEPIINNFTNKISKKHDVIISTLIFLILTIDLLFSIFFRYPL